MSDVDISVIVPCYNEAEIIERSVLEIRKHLEALAGDHEIILVDDGSVDGTYARVQALAGKLRQVRGIKFTRNFGKEAAISAGLARSRGRAVVVMDADLQHPPGMLAEFVRCWKDEGYEIVEAVKSYNSGGNVLTRLRSQIFNRVMSRFAGFNMRGASDFKLLDRRVVDTILGLPEKNRLFRGLTNWSGYRTKKIAYDVPERVGGTTKWSSLSLLRLSVTAITAFSNVPLQIITTLGAVTLMASMGLIVQTLYRKLTGSAVSGFATVIILLLLLNSIVMISLGIIGLYLANIYAEIKRRPPYVVEGEVGAE